MTNIYTWSETASDNDDADSGINWLEGQNASTVNNSSRTMMARLASLIKDAMPTRTSAGSGNAYTVTAQAAPTSLSGDFLIWFKADKTNTGAATLAVNALTAKPLRAKSGQALATGELQTGTIIGAYYSLSTDEFLIVNSGFHASVLVPTLVTSYAVGLKAGMMTSWAGTSLPAGYLWCNGAAVSRTTYADLFTAIGTTYGSGDGSTTFNVPDMRGRGPFGKDDMGGTAANRITSAGSGITGTTLGANGGAQNVTLATANLPDHSVGVAITDPGHTHTGSGQTNLAGGGNSFNWDGVNGESRTTNSATTGITATGSFGTTQRGSAQTATNKMPPTLICNWIILATPTAAGGGDIVPTYTVAGLPTSGPNIAIASDGRKNGEGAGAGTGVLSFRVSTSWFACDTGSTVQA